MILSGHCSQLEQCQWLEPGAFVKFSTAPLDDFLTEPGLSVGEEGSLQEFETARVQGREKKMGEKNVNRRGLKEPKNASGHKQTHGASQILNELPQRLRIHYF